MRRDSIGRVLNGVVSHGDDYSDSLVVYASREMAVNSERQCGLVKSVRVKDGEAMVVCRTLLTKLTEGAVGDAKR